MAIDILSYLKRAEPKLKILLISWVIFFLAIVAGNYSRTFKSHRHDYLDALVIGAMCLALMLSLVGSFLEIRPNKNKTQESKWKLLLFLISPVLFLLALVFLPKWTTAHPPNFNLAARYTAKNAFTASQMYFQDHPDGTVDIPKLKQYGFWVDKDVSITVKGGKTSLLIASYHSKGGKFYIIDHHGFITVYNLSKKQEQ